MGREDDLDDSSRYSFKADNFFKVSIWGWAASNCYLTGRRVKHHKNWIYELDLDNGEKLQLKDNQFEHHYHLDPEGETTQ